MAFAAPAPIGEFALRVLVCEDDAAQRELIATWLAAEGVIVETAEDGREALERARATPPDAVVADWLMPGLDGITLVGELRADRVLGAACIVVVTGRAEPEYARLAVDAGADLVLAKPLDPATLAAAVVAGARRGLALRRRLADSRTDPVTGLRNARALREDAERMLAVARSTGVPVCLAICDTDGRAPGGLSALVRSIGLALGPADAIYRLDDDDPGTLAVLAPDCDEPDLLVAALVAAGADAGEVLRAGASVATAGSPSDLRRTSTAPLVLRPAA